MAGRLTRIHVNQHIIKANRARLAAPAAAGWKPDLDGPLTVKDYKQNRRGYEAVIGGGIARVVYRPEAPLPCGAVCWIETREEVEVV